MDPQAQAGEPRTLDITVGEIEAICNQVTLDAPLDVIGYQPTKPQVFFFTLVWVNKMLRKHQPPIQLKKRSDVVPGVDAAQVQAHARLVAEQLDGWGAAVAGLKARDSKEWELLRIQMELAMRRFACTSAVKDDALHDSLLKVFQVLDKMPTGEALHKTPDIFTFSLEQQAMLGGIYDFHSPFYAYAQLIARHTLFYQLRRIRREPIYPINWDDLLNEPKLEDRYGFEIEEEMREQAMQRLQLQIELVRLFTLIEAQMQQQKKRRLVVWHTLSARSQYWLALAVTEQPSPFPLRPTPQASDDDIAQALATSENAVRVHRKQAKAQIEALDAAAGELLETLMDIYQSNELGWWPKN